MNLLCVPIYIEISIVLDMHDTSLMWHTHSISFMVNENAIKAEKEREKLKNGSA